MAVEMAADAGFNSSVHSSDERTGRRGATVEGGMDGVGAAIPPTMKTPGTTAKLTGKLFMFSLKLLAQAGRWSTEEKALQLAMCLTGEALSSLLLLSP